MTAKEEIEALMRELLTDFGMGHYISEDGESFSPIRWEGSPVLEKYIKEATDQLLRLVQQARVDGEAKNYARGFDAGIEVGFNFRNKNSGTNWRHAKKILIPPKAEQ